MRIFLFLVLLLLLVLRSEGQERPAKEVIAALNAVSPHVLAEGDRESHRAMLGRSLRERIRQANERNTSDWKQIDSREDWERFSHEKRVALKQSLGPLPDRPEKPRTLITGETAGEGFTVRNLVYQSRSGLLVTANLYVPQPPRATMPGFLISHSHHNPKHEGELQDMGMTWARAGCYVLVPDHLGHGERRQHPFATEADYEGAFPVGRQDYNFRYDTSLQLYLAGQTLMGWMVHDLMVGVDVLLAQPDIDPERIVLLGAVAGGGDPAAVTAAMDDRVACVAAFNFGGPQPETRYPLPDDAETSFNYAGGGSWESTRNLNRSAERGFLPWVIVGSVAPRRVIHAHEFAWDRERDPVWKRYQKIWGFYDAADQLAFAHGQGGLTSTDPPGSHCNNIGAVHRRQIHEAFGRWLKIAVQSDDEYSRRLTRAQLTCLTESAQRELQPKLLHEILSAEADGRAKSFAEKLEGVDRAERRKHVQDRWTRLLGDTKPTEPVEVREGAPNFEHIAPISVHRIILQTDPMIRVPVMILKRSEEDQQRSVANRLVVYVASDGIQSALMHNQSDIASRLRREGTTVALVEVRGTGASNADKSHGQQSAITQHSATQLMLGEPLLAGQLRDMRHALAHLRRREDFAEITVVGTSDVPALPAGSSFRYPRRIDDRPAECQPTGPLLALLLGLYEKEISSIETKGGLISYRSALESPFVQIPLEAIPPGVLAEADLPELVAALVPQKLVLRGVVDGRGQAVESSTLNSAYSAARQSFAEANLSTHLIFSETTRAD